MSTIISPTRPKSALERTMSENQFVEWSDDWTRAEWIDGKVLIMSPVNRSHAELTSFLLHLIRAFAEEHDLGNVYAEPFQVRISSLRRRRLPDIAFVSSRRKSIVKEHEIDGAPDLIVEVVSPESQSPDRREKFLEYEAAGVRELWLVDAESRSLEIYALSSRARFKLLAERDGVVASRVLAACTSTRRGYASLHFQRSRCSCDGLHNTVEAPPAAIGAGDGGAEMI